MNTRCYRCGWSFSLNREAMEEAAVGSAGQKAHVIHCPRCRQAINIPMDQILRALPAGWTPAPASEAAPAPADESETSALPASPDAAVSPVPASESAEAAERPQRRHRRSSKTHPGDSAATLAAKKSTHPN